MTDNVPVQDVRADMTLTLTSQSASAAYYLTLNVFISPIKFALHDFFCVV